MNVAISGALIMKILKAYQFLIHSNDMYFSGDSENINIWGNVQNSHDTIKNSNNTVHRSKNFEVNLCITQTFYLFCYTS